MLESTDKYLCSRPHYIIIPPTDSIALPLYVCSWLEKVTQFVCCTTAICNVSFFWGEVLAEVAPTYHSLRALSRLISKTAQVVLSRKLTLLHSSNRFSLTRKRLTRRLSQHLISTYVVATVATCSKANRYWSLTPPFPPSRKKRHVGAEKRDDCRPIIIRDHFHHITTR